MSCLYIWASAVKIYLLLLYHFDIISHQLHEKIKPTYKYPHLFVTPAPYQTH